MNMYKYLVMECRKEQKLIQDARRIMGRAEREGAAMCTVPRRMLEALIEKAQRPHD